MTDAPEQPPPAPPPAAPPPPRPADAAPAFNWRELPWFPILAVLGVVVVLIVGALALRGFAGGGQDESAYVVQPYTPTSELITARDRIEARAAPDGGSQVIVIFGQGVTLNVTGRVSRGLGNDWYAISWNDRTAFVRTQDVVPGSGAPPAPIVRERQPEEEEEEEKQDELSEPGEQVVEAPVFSGVLGVGDVNWIREPNARDFARYFPDEALEKGQSGNVVLDCTIGGSGRLDCSVASESPPGFGFGRAALNISRQLRVRATLPDGSTAAGRQMRLPLSFRAG